MVASAGNTLRPLLGFGFWVQGFRCFPWMGVNFFLKDGLKVDPSTLQLLQNSANLPMIGKPIYGIVSDAVYIGGQHRIPYIAIGGSGEPGMERDRVATCYWYWNFRIALRVRVKLYFHFGGKDILAELPSISGFFLKQRVLGKTLRKGRNDEVADAASGDAAVWFKKLLGLTFFLQAVSWLTIAVLPSTSISIFTVSLLLLLSNLGASIVEVANDALVAETGKQPTSSKKSQPSSSGELQSFVWIATSVGGVLGNLLGGIVIDRFSPQMMFLVFGLLLSVQLLTTLVVRESSLNLPMNPSSSGIRKQLSMLSIALHKPEIAYAIVWFAASYAVIPVLTGTMFFYQTQYLSLDSSVLGLSKVFGQAAMLLWSVIYNQRLKSVPPRKLISAVQVVMAMFMLSDVLFVKEFYRNLGIPDSVYVVIFSGLLEVLFIFKLLPFSVLMAQLCPPGCEGSLMAFVMSAIAFAFIVSGYLGVALVKYIGISEKDFSGLPHGILIQVACTLVPLYWSSWIPDDVKLQKKKE